MLYVYTIHYSVPFLVHDVTIACNTLLVMSRRNATKEQWMTTPQSSPMQIKILSICNWDSTKDIVIFYVRKIQFVLRLTPWPQHTYELNADIFMHRCTLISKISSVFIFKHSLYLPFFKQNNQNLTLYCFCKISTLADQLNQLDTNWKKFKNGDRS